jgi:hypothetical protein
MLGWWSLPGYAFALHLEVLTTCHVSDFMPSDGSNGLAGVPAVGVAAAESWVWFSSVGVPWQEFVLGCLLLGPRNGVAFLEDLSPRLYRIVQLGGCTRGDPSLGLWSGTRAYDS